MAVLQITGKWPKILGIRTIMNKIVKNTPLRIFTAQF
jgi:hypothetical protein